MASTKIKKKKTEEKPSMMPRQAAIPCLVIVLLALGILSFFFFASFHVG